MKIEEPLVCPRCSGKHFSVKREATYLYTYKLETPDVENRTDAEALPFLFDNREQTGSREYLQCEQCGAQYPCDIDREGRRIRFTILQKAIRADHQSEPEFLG